MALISSDNMARSSKDRSGVHKPAAASYTSFIENDKRYFQIDTYGSDERAMKGKISQSIQFDEDTAKDLIDILKKELNL